MDVTLPSVARVLLPSYLRSKQSVLQDGLALVKNPPGAPTDWVTSQARTAGEQMTHWLEFRSQNTADGRSGET